MSALLVLAIGIVAAAIWLIVRRVDVRLVLLGAGFAMSLAAGKPLAVADTFTRGMVAAMVAPICAAMAFATLVHAARCDEHLIFLLLKPLERARWLLIPGAILAGYLVNVAVPSQASTAAALGPILVPLLLASGYTRPVAGAALVLGASFGGDLLNPGSSDVQTLAGLIGLRAADVAARIVPASLAGIVVAALVFAATARRADAADTAIESTQQAPALAAVRVSVVRAFIPLVPVALLLAGYSGVPMFAWLIERPDGDEWRPLSNALPVVRAMLIGSLLALLVAYREVQALTRAFFDGMGSAYGNIISLTIAALCFGAGIEAIGLSNALLTAVQGSRALTVALSGAFPWAFAVLSGSGSGPILAFATTVLTQIRDVDTSLLAALACLGGAFGRTMSPVAAVVVYSAGLVAVSPIPLVTRLLPALALGAVVAFALVLV